MLKTSRLLFINIRKNLIRYNSSKNIPDKKPLPLPPKLPNSWECCGDSCPYCVWTVYFEDLEKYNETVKKIR